MVAWCALWVNVTALRVVVALGGFCLVAALRFVGFAWLWFALRAGLSVCALSVCALWFARCGLPCGRACRRGRLRSASAMVFGPRKSHHHHHHQHHHHHHHPESPSDGFWAQKVPPRFLLPHGPNTRKKPEWRELWSHFMPPGLLLRIDPASLFVCCLDCPHRCSFAPSSPVRLRCAPGCRPR